MQNGYIPSSLSDFDDDDSKYKNISDKEKMDRYIDVFEAVMNDDIEVVELFYNKDPDIISKYNSEKPDERVNLIQQAALEGASKVFDFLIQKGANPKQISDYEGQNLLHDAALYGHTTIFKKLLSLGVDPHHKDNNGDTILHAASYNANKEIAKLIIDTIDEKMVLAENNEGKIPVECIKTLYFKNKVKEYKKYIEPLTEAKMKEQFSTQVDLLDNKPSLKIKRKPS